MLTVLISSNDFNITEKIARNIIRSTGNSACIFYAATSTEALGIIKSKRQIIDLFFIDVNLREFGGYKLESEIRNVSAYRETPIIFITKVSYNLIGPSRLSTYHSYKKRNYISLPIDDLDVQGKIGLYLDSIISEKAKREGIAKTLVFKHAQGYVKLDIRSIVFIEVQDKCCSLHTLKGDYQLKRTGLNQLQSEINSDLLVRCHRSYILNVKNLSSIEKLSKKIWAAHFNSSDETCPISGTYIKEVYGKYGSVR